MRNPGSCPSTWFRSRFIPLLKPGEICCFQLIDIEPVARRSLKAVVALLKSEAFAVTILPTVGASRMCSPNGALSVWRGTPHSFFDCLKTPCSRVRGHQRLQPLIDDLASPHITATELAVGNTETSEPYNPYNPK